MYQSKTIQNITKWCCEQDTSSEPTQQRESRKRNGVECGNANALRGDASHSIANLCLFLLFVFPAEVLGTRVPVDTHSYATHKGTRYAQCKSKWCVIQMNEQKHFPLTDGMTCTYEEEEGDDDVAILTLVSLRVHRDKWKAKAERSAVSKAICHFSFEIHSQTNRLTVDPAEYVYRIGPLYKAVERVDVDSSVPHSLWHLSRPQCATTTIDKHGLAFVPERRMCDSRTIVRSDFKVCQYLYAQQTKVRTDSILFVWSPFLRALFAPTSRHRLVLSFSFSKIASFACFSLSLLCFRQEPNTENSVNWSMGIWDRANRPKAQIVSQMHEGRHRQQRTNTKWSKGFGLRFTVYWFWTCGRVFMAFINLCPLACGQNHSHEPQQRTWRANIWRRRCLALIVRIGLWYDELFRRNSTGLRFLATSHVHVERESMPASGSTHASYAEILFYGKSFPFRINEINHRRRTNRFFMIHLIGVGPSRAADTKYSANATKLKMEFIRGWIPSGLNVQRIFERGITCAVIPIDNWWNALSSVDDPNQSPWGINKC